MLDRGGIEWTGIERLVLTLHLYDDKQFTLVHPPCLPSHCYAVELTPIPGPSQNAVILAPMSSALLTVQDNPF